MQTRVMVLQVVITSFEAEVLLRQQPKFLAG